MKREQKELLLKDLCARLPYRLKVKCEKYPFPVTVLYAGNIDEVKFRETGGIECIYTIKPYLFPMSNMTEEQKEDLLLTVVGKEGLKLFSVSKDGIISNDKEEQSIESFCFNNINFSNETTEAYIDWLNKNHFDYRGLIPMGLAIDATNLNIY